MPPDVFLVLASSGITLVASLLFFVSDDPEPVPLPEAPVSFCLPPKRFVRCPPPLPSPPACAIRWSTEVTSSVLTLKPEGDEWLLTLETKPLRDTKDESRTHRHDGLIHQTGSLRRAVRGWKVKPGRA
jgi:hypothetical protein